MSNNNNNNNLNDNVELLINILGGSNSNSKKNLLGQCGVADYIYDDIKNVEYFMSGDINQLNMNDPKTRASLVNVYANTSPKCNDNESIALITALDKFMKCNGYTNQQIKRMQREGLSSDTVKMLQVGLQCTTQMLNVNGDDNNNIESSLYCADYANNNKSTIRSAQRDDDKYHIFNNGSGGTCNDLITGKSNTILGMIFEKLLTQPYQGCQCFKELEETIPHCYLNYDNMFIDGGRISKYSCLVTNGQQCSDNNLNCDARLKQLDQCLPSMNELYDMKLYDWDMCKQIMCDCESTPSDSILKYSAQMMKLSLPDICTKRCHYNNNKGGNNNNNIRTNTYVHRHNYRISSNRHYNDVPKRYQTFQQKCGYTTLSNKDDTMFITEGEANAYGYEVNEVASTSTKNITDCGLFIVGVIISILILTILAGTFIWKKNNNKTMAVRETDNNNNNNNDETTKIEDNKKVGEVVGEDDHSSTTTSENVSVEEHMSSLSLSLPLDDNNDNDASSSSVEK